MIKHKRGVNISPEETQAYIKAALKMHGKQSLRKIALLTGYHFNTVKRHVMHLLADGAVEKVQKEEYEYRLSTEGGT